MYEAFSTLFQYPGRGYHNWGRPPPTLRLCGPVVPAGTAREDVAPALPHLPLPVQPSPPPLPGPSMVTAWPVSAEWSGEASVSEAPVPLHLPTATSTQSIPMRRSLSSLLLLHNPSTLHVLCSQGTLCPDGTAELSR